MPQPAGSEALRSAAVALGACLGQLLLGDGSLRCVHGLDTIAAVAIDAGSLFAAGSQTPGPPVEGGHVAFQGLSVAAAAGVGHLLGGGGGVGGLYGHQAVGSAFGAVAIDTDSGLPPPRFHETSMDALSIAVGDLAVAGAAAPHCLHS